MASVTSMTAERILELVNEQVVSGAIGSNGHLILTTKGGEQRDAGVVVDPLKAWPIGSIFMSTSAASPTQLLGGGTWVRWGKGRVPVSLNEADASFNTVEETGGAKTRTILAQNLPPHTHTMNHNHPPVKVSYNWRTDVTLGGTNIRVTDIGGQTIGGGDLEVAEFGVSNFNGNTGDGPGASSPLDNLPPYITCYMWKRTA